MTNGPTGWPEMPFDPVHVCVLLRARPCGGLSALPCSAPVHRSQQSQDFKSHASFVKADMLRGDECSGMAPWEIRSFLNCENK